MTHDGLLPFIDECLFAAVPVALRSNARLTHSVKDGDRNQVVTEVDLAVGALLVERIRRYHPADSVIEEETGAIPGSSSRTWIVDPIDGTSNYAAGSPLYGIMVAVLDHGAPVAAGIALPAFDETYLATSGQGVHLNGRPLDRAGPLSLVDHLLAYGLDVGPDDAMREDWQLLRGLAPRCRGIRMSNSIFDAVQVVRGTYGGYLHRRLRVWDIAPMQVLVTESGGSCTDLANRPVDYSTPTPRDGRSAELDTLVAREYAVCATACGVGGELRDVIRQIVTVPAAG